MKKFFLSLIIIATIAISAQEKLEETSWNGVNVSYLPQTVLPIYSIYFYFADGSLSDEKNKMGTTDLMFELIDHGTRRFSQKQISDHLDFYGVKYEYSVAPEYSTFSMHGLMKDLVPTLKTVCHLFDDSVFPDTEVSKIKKLKIDSLKNSVTSPDKLVSRIFREVSLAGTDYAIPSSGKISTLNNINKHDLVKKLEYFVKNVSKKIYLAGHEI